MFNGKFFFGWKNIKTLLREFIFIFSSKRSFFSKKRIESTIAFGIGQAGMLYYMYKNVENMTSSDMLIWAGIEFAISGYIVSQIEQNKKAHINNDINNDINDAEDIS